MSEQENNFLILFTNCYNQIYQPTIINMKKLLVITLCVLGLYSCGKRRPAVIERPVFDVWSSTVIEIDKIEMSDSATVFHIDAYLRPKNRIKIDKGAYIRESGSDEKFLIIHAEGINLDEQTVVPESGTISLRLFFPPLKPEITKIDFIDSDYKIWGIYLLPDAKIKFEPVPTEALKTSTEPLPTPEYSTEPAKISGRMLGYDKRMELDNVTISAFNIPIIKKLEAAFLIAEDGSFSGGFTPYLASIYESSLGPMFLIPGKEAKIYVDLKKRSRYQSRYRTDKEPNDSIYTYVSGNFTISELDAIKQVSRGSISGALPDMAPDIQTFYRAIAGMNPEEFKQYVLGFMNKRLDEIRQKGYSANMQMMMENAVKIQVYSFLMQYEGLIFNSYLQANNITTREEMDKVTYKPEKPGIEYFSVMKGELNDNISYLPMFLGMVEILNDVNGFFKLPGNRKNYSAKERFDHFEEKYVAVMGNDKGILYDMVQTLHYGWKLFDIGYFTDAEKQEIRDIFSDKPVYVETLITESDRMELILTATQENNESIKNELPDVPQEQMLEVIIAKYKGKVVVADVWGTWCGPCMTAMKSIQPLKDEMKGKGVVFLYLADETSPLDEWEKTIPAIAGEHYRGNQLKRNFWEISAYPTYMIFDRQGKQLSKHVDFPGIDAMKRDIEKGL
jgi:thiol-disulfide isomerase/thioredoxin